MKTWGFEAGGSALSVSYRSEKLVRFHCKNNKSSLTTTRSLKVIIQDFPVKFFGSDLKLSPFILICWSSACECWLISDLHYYSRATWSNFDGPDSKQSIHLNVWHDEWKFAPPETNMRRSAKAACPLKNDTSVVCEIFILWSIWMFVVTSSGRSNNYGSKGGSPAVPEGCQGGDYSRRLHFNIFKCGTNRYTFDEGPLAFQNLEVWQYRIIWRRHRDDIQPCL